MGADPIELKVAVIGAGVAGLVVARELRRAGHRVVIFEKSDKVGGTWAYDPRTESNPLSHGMVHSSMYLSLRTNLPRALMEFSDFRFSEKVYEDPRDYPGHQEVLAFLNDFANRFGVAELVRFNSEVVQVEPVRGRVEEWVVEWREGGVNLEDAFDAVVICNGQNTVPRVPDIPGIEIWPGNQIHSHNYRTPEPFKNQVVVVIGKGPSAYDISRDIATVAKEVHLSNRSPDTIFSKIDQYENMWQHSEIHMAKEDGVVEFRDGSFVQANMILHCTGYKYEFPFLKLNGTVNVGDNRVGPLYKHVFPPKLAPRLSFVGLLKRILVFETLELQAKWVARVLSGKVCLPSTEEMIGDVEEYYEQMIALKKPKHLTHDLHNSQEYTEWVAGQAEAAPIEEWKWKTFENILKGVQKRED